MGHPVEIYYVGCYNIYKRSYHEGTFLSSLWVRSSPTHTIGVVGDKSVAIFDSWSLQGQENNQIANSTIGVRCAVYQYFKLYQEKMKIHNILSMSSMYPI